MKKMLGPWQWLQLLVWLWCSMGAAAGDFVMPSTDLWHETWSNKVFPAASSWLNAEDEWLFTNVADKERPAIARVLALKTPIATKRLTVPSFTKLNVQTACQIQLDGGLPANSVIIFGSHAESSRIKLSVKNSTLMIKQSNAGLDRNHANNVVVVVAINNLQELRKNGSGQIRGRVLDDAPLKIINHGSGDISLSSKRLNLTAVQQNGSGNITLFGVYTPDLTLDSTLTGNINLQGKVGIDKINHLGRGDINIIGVDTNNLAIVATGSGKITLSGVMNLKQLAIGGDVQVYCDKVHSSNLYVALNDHAVVGIIGYAQNLSVVAMRYTLFAGGELFSNYGYLRAYNLAHINARIKERAFTAADNTSSIYLIGKPSFMVPYSYHNSTIVVLPIGWLDS
jgi:hypothetical protein